MIKKGFIQAITAAFLLIAPFAIAQEPSADVSNEKNTDAFQEYFYESLKQKGIENYDKAVTALLECKMLEPDNHVIDYELGLNYMYNKQYIEAQSYLEQAISIKPDNKWYLDALLKCYKAQHDVDKAVEVASRLAKKNSEYYSVLADLFIEQQDYNKAVEVLDKMALDGKNATEVKQKKTQIRMLKNIDTIDNVENNDEAVKDEEAANNPVEDYKKQILKQQQKTDYNEMLEVSSEALDNYPTQPEFYYLKGISLNKLQKFEEAASVLEEGLDYIIDDNTLQNNIYKELVFAYKGLNNPEKTKEYQQKMKVNN